ncbi:SDR family NAD(P)-dependent oxidoreductase [Motilibacter deserti]|uniref:SDR family oxidoreductase n=1 Tax=Motilibacter deserti TaxID=2714956 RepID=A0ABX0GT30_9ACTN|nr:SDR family oxidoreductase [Motilibacter deserti]
MTAFQDRTVLLTGASGGIGRALAERLAQEGARLALAYSGDRAGAERTAQLVREAGGEPVVLQADLADAEAPLRLADEAEQELGPVDVLVSAAGAGEQRELADVGLELWDRTQAVNLRAPFLLMQRLVPQMAERGYGRVLLFSSIAAFTGGVVGPHYAASKAGLHGLVHWFASRYADRGVTVNAVAPALIEDTKMLPGNGRDMPLPIPVGRLGRPEEVADLALAVLRNGYVTNHVQLVDGGLFAL